ncbi:uncharacterized protein LOC129353521 [Poeciliopsis prolifica]|uniref:uncharacterized protein LOC129353521 n=1 Tax=Poeciliopsis prolifica TaxID=188132 RepID=UPI002413F6CA|nr:uncharacterized protein LOC129353521 [Poeciliopsis prolifica]
MASTPSASALSAVLRCRGNIWTRNPPTKRPASAAYSLGLAGGPLRDSPAERGGSSRGSERRILRLVSAAGLSVCCKGDSEAPAEEVFRKNHKLSSKLSQSPACGAPSGQKAPLQQREDVFSKIIHIIVPEAPERICLQGFIQLPAGVLKLSVSISSGLKVQNPGSSLTWFIFSKPQMKSGGTDPTQEHTCSSGRQVTHDPPD